MAARDDIGNVLVTGANGFLGGEIVKQLVESGLRVRASDIQPGTRHHGIPEYKGADIRFPDQVSSLMQGVDFVVHAAGLAHRFNRSADDANLFHSVNVLGTENIVRSAAATGVKGIVLISSVSVYGPSSTAATEETALAPEGHYALSKLGAEQGALSIAAETGMKLVVLRLATLYGEGDPGNISRLIRAIDSYRFLPIGAGANCKSLLYRDDAARAVRHVLERDFAWCGIFNVPGGTHSMKEIVDEIAAALKKRVFTVHLPQKFVILVMRALLNSGQPRLARMGRLIHTWLANDTYNGTRFEISYKYKPQVQLTEGLRREVCWLTTSAVSR